MPFTDDDVAEVRHVVQRILVPCVFVIGLLGNSVSIYVLTRRRMRCTTNIYLTALAITDIIYLTMALLLSLQHYPYVHLHWKFYWMCFGTLMWLVDACSYISIYIAVCFTIERFIAIRYPLKRQTFCSESLAKKVIAGVALFCVLSTISTAFEHQHSIEYRMMDSLGKPCNQTMAKAYELHKKQLQEQRQQHQDQQQKPLKVMENFVEFLDETEGSGEHNDRAFILKNDLHDMERLNQGKQTQDETQGEQYRRKRKAKFNRADLEALTSRTLTNIPSHQPITMTLSSASSSSSPSPLFAHLKKESSVTQNPLEDEVFLMDTTEFEITKQNLGMAMAGPTVAHSPTALDALNLYAWENETTITSQMENRIFLNVTDFCENVTYYSHKPTALGMDDFYLDIWFPTTLCVFVLIPLCVLSTFNCFLIMLVRRSNTIRGEMTNANSMRRPKQRKSASSSVSQENRVTITLIAVVLLFIICQLPWAIYLILLGRIDIDYHLQAIFGNIFNFLAAINAAANFLLYCVLSDKYRKTVREMITGYRYKQQRNTLTTTSLYTNGSRRSYRPASSSMVIK